MKILFIAPFNLKLRDGTTTRVLNLTRAALQISEEVYLLSPTVSEDLQLNRVIHVKIRYLRPMYHFALAYMSELFRFFRSRFNIEVLGLSRNDAIRLKDIDVIHVHWVLFKYIAKIISRVVEIPAPIVIDLHGSWNLQYPSTQTLRDILAFELGRKLESYVLARNEDSAFTSPSKNLNVYLARRYGINLHRMFEVRDFVEPEVIESSKRCDSIDEVNKIVEKMPANVVAYSGSITTYHGFPDLLKAFIVAKKILAYDIKMLLITPNQPPNLKSRDIIVLNNIPRRLIPCILRRATVLVIPHRTGTQFDYIPSNKIYDYMLAGRPIVAYMTPAANETLIEYSMYLPVKPNDPVELARGIAKAVELYGKSEPKPAYDKVPTLNEVAEALKKVYLSLIK